MTCKLRSHYVSLKPSNCVGASLFTCALLALIQQCNHRCEQMGCNRSYLMLVLMDLFTSQLFRSDCLHKQSSRNHFVEKRIWIHIWAFAVFLLLRVTSYIALHCFIRYSYNQPVEYAGKFCNKSCHITSKNLLSLCRFIRN